MHHNAISVLLFLASVIERLYGFGYHLGSVLQKLEFFLHVLP